MRTLAVIICISAIPCQLNAQWVRTNAPTNPSGVYALLVQGNTLYAGIYSNGVYASSDYGITWAELNTGLFSYSITDLVASDSILFVATRGFGIFRSTNRGLEWTSSSTGLGDLEVYTLLATDSLLFAGTGGGMQAGAYTSTDMGLTWSLRNVGLNTPAHIKSIAIAEDLVFAGVYGAGPAAGVFISSNHGNSWVAASTGLTATYVNRITVVGSSVLAGMDNGGGIFVSTNRGVTWAPGNSGLSDSIIQSFVVKDSEVFAGTYSGGVHLSRDSGASWAAINSGLSNMDIKSLAVDSLFVYAGVAGGWFGENGVWRRPLQEVIPPVPVQLGSFAGHIVQGGVILRWRTISEVNNFGFEIQRKSAQASDYITLPNSFVPGHGSTLLPHDYEFIDRGAGPGRWFYRLRQIDLDGTVHFSDPIQVDVLTDVQQAATPLQFRLYQNYPNPFNPTTTIRYDLPEQAHVRLALFDMLGREVRVLVDEFQYAGEKRVTLDAAGLASGVYVGRLTAMGKTATIVVDLLR